MHRFDLHTINPYIRVAMPSILPIGHEIRRRAIFDYELIYLERGNFILCYADREYYCTPGQFIFLHPGVSHNFCKLTTEISQPHIHFDMCYTANSPRVPVSFKDLPAFTAEERTFLQPDLFEGQKQSPLLAFQAPEQAHALFERIVQMPPNAAPLLQKALLLELLNMLITDHFPEYLITPTENRYSIAQQIKDFIDAGQGVNLLLNELEKQFSYSKYYLERQFKAEFGISLIAYRNQKRMQSAQELLCTNTVAATAEKLGFSSIYVFSRAYKKHFGVCPSQSKHQSAHE